MSKIGHSKFSRIRNLGMAVFVGLGAMTLTTSMALAGGVTVASEINPYFLLDQSRTQLAQRFPALSSRELDLLNFRVADIRSMREGGVAGPAGDWFCVTGDNQPIRLTMRAKSYVINRSGQAAMAGEYEHASHDLSISNGPLRGMGFAGGTFAAAPPRSPILQSEDGQALHCHEVL